MPFSDRDKQLGMDRGITRRDFLDGVALVIGAAALGGFHARPAMAQTAYPPTGTGLRGQTDAAQNVMHAIRDGAGCSARAFTGKTLMMVLNGWNDLKNGAIALRAFARARSIDPALKLVCFGAGYEPRGNAQRWAQRRGFADGVEFRGPVPHDTVLRQMRESAALVHPSRWEACCMSIAEAMSVGLPVIAGRHTDGVSWQLDDGRAGVLADVTKVDDISRAMITQTRDERAWREMSTTARARARQLFNVDQVVGQYVALYHAALDSAATESVSRAVHP